MYFASSGTLEHSNKGTYLPSITRSSEENQDDEIEQYFWNFHARQFKSFWRRVHAVNGKRLRY